MGADVSQEILHREITGRIRAALEIKDWSKIEYWARKWIQVSPTNSEGFKWLARASVAQNNLKMAGYAYSRMLDFDPQSVEAVKFFENYPSYTWDDNAATPSAGVQAPATETASETASPRQVPLPHLAPDMRKKLAVKHFELAGLYEEAGLMELAAKNFLESYERQASQVAGLASARTLHAAQKSGEAIRFLRAQIENFPNWAEGRMLLGRINFEVGYRAEAQKQYQMVLKLDPQHKQALQALRQLMIP